MELNAAHLEIFIDFSGFTPEPGLLVTSRNGSSLACCIKGKSTRKDNEYE